MTVKEFLEQTNYFVYAFRINGVWRIIEAENPRLTEEELSHIVDSVEIKKTDKGEEVAFVETKYPSKMLETTCLYCGKPITIPENITRVCDDEKCQLRNDEIRYEARIEYCQDKENTRKEEMYNEKVY